MYARRADHRAELGERRDALRFAGEQTEAEVAVLDEIAEAVQRVAEAQKAAATDPQSRTTFDPALARLRERLDQSELELPGCAKYAEQANPALLADAVRELEQRRAALRPPPFADAW